MPIVRNTDGFSSRLASDPLALFNFNDPINYPYFLEDFYAYDIAQTAGNPYTLTATNCADTIVGPTGVLLLTLAGADNDSGQVQLTETPIQLNSKRLWFDTKVKIKLASGGTIAANELFFGLASEQVTTSFFAGAGTSVTADNMLGFYKLDAEAAMSVTMRENDVASVESLVVTPVDDTYMRLSIYYDGAMAHFYKDGAEVATLATVDVTSVLTPTLYIKAGEAKANLLYCDYIFVGQER